MNNAKSARKDIYYTSDHEWIDFQGAVAYIGVAPFKLTGFKKIQQITFDNPSGFKKSGDLIAVIRYNDFEINVCMPVDGKLVEVNTNLIYGNPDLLLTGTGDAAWVALIAPSQPYERKGLILSKHYQMNTKSKYAK